ncbi:MAG TPA: DegT/DnrJ/EryC1/StrS family aminotransferase [Thermoanaerobaculia bacterium]|nr:DegT/DnrJ/EryC1/StrS family aminotransferase [Thermoanaerobaculia bacterium]
MADGKVLHVGRPNIGNRQRFLERVEQMLDRRWLTNDGPLVQELEQRLAAFLGVRHVVAMCNATVGMEVALRALGATGEVIVPSFTFVATAHVPHWLGLTPVFAEVGADTHTLDPASVERAITPRTSAIAGVHLWGRACDVDALADIARRHDLKLMFDAAHAFACTHKGAKIGGFGDVEVFSFHATKFFNTFEGGAATTNDDELAKKMRLMRNFGFAGYDRVVSEGTNAKMTEVSAAMGLTNLESVDRFIGTNRRHWQHYNARLGGMKGLRVAQYDDREANNYQYVVVEVGADVDRDRLVEKLWSEGVLARRYFTPGAHRAEPYRSQVSVSLPVTERLCERVLVLPNGTDLDEDDVERVCALIEAELR